MSSNAELTGRRSAQRGGYPEAQLLGAPVERRVGRHFWQRGCYTEGHRILPKAASVTSFRRAGVGFHRPPPTMNRLRASRTLPSRGPSSLSVLSIAAAACSICESVRSAPLASNSSMKKTVRITLDGNRLITSTLASAARILCDANSGITTMFGLESIVENFDPARRWRRSA